MLGWRWVGGKDLESAVKTSEPGALGFFYVSFVLLVLELCCTWHFSVSLQFGSPKKARL